MVFALLTLFLACHSPYASLREAVDIPPTAVLKFKPEFSTAVYKTEVDVVGKRFSGLLVFKTMPDNSRRAVFTSETGPTLFDFEWAAAGFRVRYCYKKLNRKAVVRTLRKDFELLLMEQPGVLGARVLRDSTRLYFPFAHGKETNYYVTDSSGRAWLGAEKAGRRKKKVILSTPPTAAGLPDSAHIEHRNFNFSIRLAALRREE